MIPTLPNADELEVVALLKERDGQTFDGEVHLSSAEAAAITAQIERLTRERDDAYAAISEAETEAGITNDGNLWRFWSRKAQEVADKLVSQTARLVAAEAREKRLRGALEHISSPSQTTGLLWWQVAARSALSGGTSNG